MKKKLKNWWEFEKEDIDRRIRDYSKFRLLLLLSVIVGFITSLFWFWVKSNLLPIEKADLFVLNYLSKNQSILLTKYFSFLTILGSVQFISFLFLLIAIYLFIKRRKRAAVVMFVVLIMGGLINILLRNYLFERARPGGCITEIFGINSCFSFPSGHTLWAVYFYGLIDYLIFRFFPISMEKYLFISLMIIILIFFISLSRLYLGVHYLSDIIGGMFLGCAWLTMAVLLIDILYHEP